VRETTEERVSYDKNLGGIGGSHFNTGPVFNTRYRSVTE
jgi:hypothetical protein